MPYLNLLTKTTADSVLLRKILIDLCRAREKEISVTLCSQNQIRIFNQKYRHQNSPTDVLSFATGDIIIAPAVAWQNACRYQHSLTAELIYLMIHGLCHLRGHDHDRQQNIRRMRQAENKLLAYVRKKYNIIIVGRI